MMHPSRLQGMLAALSRLPGTCWLALYAHRLYGAAAVLMNMGCRCPLSGHWEHPQRVL